MLSAPLTASMRFTEAAAAFLASRTAPEAPSFARYVSKRTLKDYRGYFKTLGLFFGDLPLNQIHMGHFVEYQRRRAIGEGFTRVPGNRKGAAPVPSPAGPDKINAELGRLKRLMKMAAAWTPELEAYYQPFQQVDSDLPRALTPEQQEQFLVTAAANPAWNVVWWYGLVALHVTFSSDEMRTIRLSDVNLTHKLLSVNRNFGKNRQRRRSVILTDGGCLWALARLVERAVALGATGPHHFLFPFCTHSCSHGAQYDPNRPMSETGLRKPFEQVRKAAGVPWFKFNCFRHTGITRLAEDGVPISMIQKRAGHTSPKMTQHYTDISEAVERARMERMRPRVPGAVAPWRPWETAA